MGASFGHGLSGRIDREYINGVEAAMYENTGKGASFDEIPNFLADERRFYVLTIGATAPQRSAPSNRGALVICPQTHCFSVFSCGMAFLCGDSQHQAMMRF
jgi:hypothetical protein